MSERKASATGLSMRFQLTAATFCVLFASAIIVNVQLGGEAVWFWYATLLHHGVKLYTDLHFALQPLYVLLTDGWMLLFGSRCLPYELMAVVNAVLLCLGMLLLLRNSDWPDAPKAIVLAASFLTSIMFVAYRFDDFHVVADYLVLGSLVLLLLLERQIRPREQMACVAGLGALSGLALTTRITDGGALLVATGLCIPFLAKRRKVGSVVLFVASAALVLALVVGLTHDSFHSYLANSIFHAASAKGGTGTVLHGPIAAFLDNLRRLRTGGKRTLVVLTAILAGGVLLARRRKPAHQATIIAAQLALAAVAFACTPQAARLALMQGALISTISTVVQTLTYFAAPVVILWFVLGRRGRGTPAWQPRAVLLLVVLATLLSAAASQASGTSNSFITLALITLLVPIFLSWRAQPPWATGSFLTVLILTAASACAYKVRTPYSWNAYAYKPMFVDRQWYQHPVYGPMYLQRDLLQFMEPICADIKKDPTPELLSLPYPYPNYFCAIPPWRGYVQTWFDTATPATIATLIGQLQTAPPAWILYQRQLRVLRSHEVEYNHGRPIAHRELDELIMSKIASGQWSLVEKRNYLEGDGWFLIRTHP